MKLNKIIVVMLMSIASQMSFGATKSVFKIEKIEPEFWYTGMKETQLQLMVYGPQIAEEGFILGSYEGVTLQKVIKLDSPNYMLIYLNVDHNAQPGTMQFIFTNKKGKKTSVNYELKKREKDGSDRYGFDANDVLYMLMPDRFSCGKNLTEPLPDLQPYVVDRTKPSLRHGGDLEGIRQHLDYFTDLGVTALWLTPVLENNSPDHNNRSSTYHGYATTNYYRVDPRFGTNEEYRQLVDECHEKGLKLVMDMIFNHCGYEHPWNVDRPSKDWFNVPEDGSYLQTSYKLTPILDPYASKTDYDQTTLGWFVHSMPDLNQKNPHVLRYLIQNSKWWIETAGIDGIRMDTYPYADRQAMSDWMKELLDEYPNFNVVGETWVNEPAYTASWQKDSPNTQINSYLPTVMDFSFFDRISSAASEQTDGWGNGLNRIYNSFAYDFLYADPLHVMAFIENHDTDRFLKDGQNVPMLKQALTLLLTTRRIPQLYYGTEVLMNGTKEKTDGNVRKDFPGGWAEDTHNAFTKEGRTDAEQDMFAWLSKILHWRQKCDAVTKGTMTHFCPVNGCYVYARQYEGKTVLIILNGTDKEQTLPLKHYAEIIGSKSNAMDLTSEKNYDLQNNLKLSPRESLILPL
ncbi:MAG: glycoside hydrolase family 13 protein [Bacteroidaceae bacterium]|nr:glycoside hydrolase family 13 protein [Bacteroidaceae bacterium]